jgi:maltooligosyltrehalose trehalohydrolase
MVLRFMADRWQPTLGAVAGSPLGVRFEVWAPTTRAVDLVVERPGEISSHRALARQPNGRFAGTFPDLTPGTRYRYALDGEGPFPDPASRFQPDGVHGSSMVIDPAAFRWCDDAWTGVAPADLVLYELHVGTFTPSGTFAGVTERLAYLKALGITAVELMPVADFPGTRNWGYDGAALFGPARCYGTPDDMRTLVDTAHRLGLAVILDVVYNHTGPDGAYLRRFSPYYFTSDRPSPWGAGINLDGEHSAQVRAFFIENALHWMHEYHIDGLRLDATHAMSDDGPRHFLAELTARVRASVQGRQVHLIAEDHRNLAVMVRPERESGWGLDAVWADDFHHQMRRLLAGDSEGYYGDFSGTIADVVATLRQGWFFTGQYSEHLRAPRGTDASALPPSRFVVCLQNHDQVGNRALGERLHHQIDLAAYRAASVLLLTAPQTPLLFMGQEWAASSPFLYFTDHSEELGRLVTEGRRREFGAFSAFADETARADIPDPQADMTFMASRLDWVEVQREPHASVLRLYSTVLAFRRDALVPAETTDAVDVRAVDDTIVLRRRCRDGAHAVVVVRLGGAGTTHLSGHWPGSGASTWTCLLTSEDAAFGSTGSPPVVDLEGAAPSVRFSGPAAVILKAVPAASPAEGR